MGDAGGCAAAASITKGDNVVYWLASTRQVMLATGYNPKIISTRKMKRELEKYDTISDALAWVQVFEGHTFYWLVFPSANATWIYDAATQVWHTRASFPNQSRHRANCYAYWQKKHYVGDYHNGVIYEMSSSYYDDNGTEMIAELQSPELRNEGKKMFFSGLQLTFEQGHVDLDRQPQAMLQWSDDGGNVWSNEVWADIGDIGQYATRTQRRRLGSSYQRIFKLRVSDPVNRDILAVNWL